MLLNQPFSHPPADNARRLCSAARRRVWVLLSILAALSGFAGRTTPAQAQTQYTPSSLAVSPTSVIGGNSATGTVQLSQTVSPNFPRGVNVALASSDPAVASVPRSVTVPAGKNAASFPISTAKVLTAQSVVIGAALNGVTRTAKLGVQPAVRLVPALNIKPDRLDFGAAAVGVSAGRQRITLTNVGNAPLSLGRFGLSGAQPGDFFIRGAANLDAPLPPNNSGWIEIEFVPQAVGSRGAFLVFASNAAGSPHSVPLSGTGLASFVRLDPEALNFGGQPLGTRSGAQFVTLFNVGNAPLAVRAVGIAGNPQGDFLVLSGGEAGTIPAGGRRTIAVAFAPVLLGQRTGLLTVLDNANRAYSVPLRGLGLPPLAPEARVAPTSLAFGSQAVGTRSNPQSVTVANIGTAPLTIRGVSINGAQAGEFVLVSGAEPIVVPVGGQRAISVLFAPTDLGNRAASLAIVSNAANSPHVVSLSGTGAPVPLPPAHFQPALPVGNDIAATGRLGIFNLDPLDEDQDVSAVRRIADDGSLYVLDYAGTALLRLARGPQTASVAAAGGQARTLQSDGATPEILLDTTRQDPLDQVGLARLLRVETGRDGVCAVLALRADNTRGIYRLQKGVLTRLALLAGPTGPAEIAISDAGQIAYVAPSSSGGMALWQATGDGRVELVRQGQLVQGGGPIATISDLSSNSAGDLVALLDLTGGEQAILRVTRRGPEAVEVTGPGGRPVARDLFESRAGARPGMLTQLRHPRIGPDGTVVFLGAGADFVNCYIDGPARFLQPMLIGGSWSLKPDSFDYEIAASGSAILRIQSTNAASPALYLSLPSGGLIEVVKAGEKIVPVGLPNFGPEGNESRFYFEGRVSDRQPDRQGNLPLGLFRAGWGNGRLVMDPVAGPGDAVPGKRGATLIGVTQRPAVAANEVTFGILFGDNSRSPVPTASLFRVPLGGKLADGSLVVDEGAEVPNAGRWAMFRDLSYQPDGSLVLSGLLPGAGPVIGALQGDGAGGQGAAGPASKGGAGIAARSARVQAIGVAPLLTIGQPMAPPDRRLLAVLGRLISLGADRQLLVARYSQANGLNGEGLFTLDRTRLVQSVAATGEAARDMATAPFIGFADTQAATLNPPAVAADGSLVFKARLARGASETFGIFQATGAGSAAVALAEPDPDDLRVLPTDQAPYSLDRWVAAPGGSAYLMARPLGGKARLYKRAAAAGPAAAPIQALVVPDLTPLAGTTPVTLSQVADFAVNGAGSVFVAGTSGTGQGLFRVDGEGAAARLTPVALQGLPVPPAADGTKVQGFVFNGTFSLMPDSARGALLFLAQVAKAGAAPRQGLFRLGAAGVETIMVESLEVGGARELTFGTLALSPARQTANGASAFATFNNGRWSIFRWRAGVTSLVAQEGQALPGGSGAKVVSLDPGPVLSLPPGSGPVFTINDAGDVAFLATDGLKWGIYLFSDRF